MSNLNSYLKIALQSIKCFSDDGTLDTGEVNYLLGLAKADGNVDDDEKRVLGEIFDKVTRDDVDAGTWNRIVEIRTDLKL